VNQFRAMFAEDLQALFEQARNERQVGANSSAQNVENFSRINFSTNSKNRLK